MGIKIDHAYSTEETFEGGSREVDCQGHNIVDLSSTTSDLVREGEGLPNTIGLKEVTPPVRLRQQVLDGCPKIHNIGSWGRATTPVDNYRG
jgi:hypothetical protein